MWHELEGDGSREDILCVANDRLNPLRIAADVRTDNSARYHLRHKLQNLGLGRNGGPVLIAYISTSLISKMPVYKGPRQLTLVSAKVFVEGIGSLIPGRINLLANFCDVLCLDRINSRVAENVVIQRCPISDKELRLKCQKIGETWGVQNCRGSVYTHIRSGMGIAGYGGWKISNFFQEARRQNYRSAIEGRERVDGIRECLERVVDDLRARLKPV